jgi:hypothetical protein
MPTSTFVSGSSTRRPGVYASVDASALGGAALTTNVMGIVGDFPELESAVPTRFNTANQLKGASPSYINQLIAKVLYNPANDPKVAGSPSAVYLINGGTSTQASLALVDAVPLTGLTLKSKKWGPLGNTGVVSCVVPAGGTGGDRTLTISINGTTETWAFDGQTLMTLGYIGTDNDAVTLSVKDTSATKLQISQSRSGIGSGALSLATASWKWDDEPIFVASGSGNHSLSVTGIRKDTGAVFTQVLTFTASATPDAALGFDVAAITALTWTPGAAETLSVSGFGFDIDLTATEFKTIKDVGDHILAYTGQGWSVTYNEPSVGSIDSINLDKVTAGTDIFNPATQALTADLYRLWVELQKSELVDVDLGSITTAGLTQIAAYVGVKSLAGGSFSAGTSTTVGNAYTACRTEDIQIFVNFYTDLATQQELRTHCQYMASQGLGECNGWTAMPADDTKTTIKTRTGLLNSRHIGMAAQEIQVSDHLGATVWAAPLYQAVMFAAIQASTPVGTPLTRKLANVLDVRSDSTWNGDDDANELLKYGLCFLTTDRLGFKVERSITTYQTDDNAVFSEVSANESLYTAIRDLRRNLNLLVGDPALASTATSVKSLAKARLRWQVKNNMIKAFNEGALNVEDLGDTFRVNVELAVVEPLNFIQVAAKVTRIPFSA